jgi:hypothetical protein
MRRKYLTAAIGLLFILLYCSGCSSAWKQNYHIRMADKHVRKAELKGAVWKHDTTFLWKTFKSPELKVKFDPQVIHSGKMIFEKDGVVTSIEKKKTAEGKEELDVQTICPPCEHKEKIPVAINKKLEPGKSNWFWYKWLAVVAVLSFIGGYIYRGKNKVIVHSGHQSGKNQL